MYLAKCKQISWFEACPCVNSTFESAVNERKTRCRTTKNASVILLCPTLQFISALKRGIHLLRQNYRFRSSDNSSYNVQNEHFANLNRLPLNFGYDFLSLHC